MNNPYSPILVLKAQSMQKLFWMRIMKLTTINQHIQIKKFLKNSKPSIISAILYKVICQTKRKKREFYFPCFWSKILEFYFKADNKE